MMARWTGLLGMAVSALAMLIAVASLWWIAGQPVPPAQLTGLPMPAVVPPVDNLRLQALESVKGRLQKLAQGGYAPSQALDMKPLGYTRPTSAEQGTQTITGVNRLTMAVVMGKDRYCVIDGKFLREGERLDKQTRVIRIRPDKVQINTSGQYTWLELNNVKEEQEAAAR